MLWAMNSNFSFVVVLTKSAIRLKQRTGRLSYALEINEESSSKDLLTRNLDRRRQVVFKQTFRIGHTRA